MKTTFVSIHAPAWGATDFFPNSASILLSFNPRARVGRDRRRREKHFQPREFQSTRPRGARRGYNGTGNG